FSHVLFVERRTSSQPAIVPEERGVKGYREIECVFRTCHATDGLVKGFQPLAKIRLLPVRSILGILLVVMQVDLSQAARTACSDAQELGIIDITEKAFEIVQQV